MFGSIGQPVSGVKSNLTARVFTKLLQDEAAERDERQRQERRRRQRILGAIKGWFMH